MLGLVEAAGCYDFDRNILRGDVLQRIRRAAYVAVGRSAPSRFATSPARPRRLLPAAGIEARWGRPDDETLAAWLTSNRPTCAACANGWTMGAEGTRRSPHPRPGRSTPRGWWNRSQPEPRSCRSRPSCAATASALSTLPERDRIIVVGLYLDLPELRGAGPAAGRHAVAHPPAAKNGEMLREGIERILRTAWKDRPKGRVELGRACYAAAYSQMPTGGHATWNRRPSRCRTPWTCRGSP